MTLTTAFQIAKETASRWLHPQEQPSIERRMFRALQSLAATNDPDRLVGKKLKEKGWPLLVLEKGKILYGEEATDEDGQALANNFALYSLLQKASISETAFRDHLSELGHDPFYEKQAQMVSIMRDRVGDLEAVVREVVSTSNNPAPLIGN